MTQPVRPMRVVLGGIPALSDIVGRETERSEVLESFHGHGALLTGDRRFGKTSLTRLVEAASVTAGDTVVRVSAERSSFEDFVDALADEFLKMDSAIKNAIRGWQASMHAGPLKVERAPTRTRSLDTLLRVALEANGGKRVVLILDEIPILAQAMERERAGSGAELLHLLRRLRQDHPGRLVMVLSGSIGFHHVTQDALGATNDVTRVAVGPLDREDAVYLARCLLLGEEVPTSNEHEVANAIADAAERVPYYVHNLVKSARDSARREGRAVEPATVASLVEAALHDPDDAWDLRHYRDRIPSYYGEQASLAVDVLDVYAASDEALGVDQVLRLLASLRDESPQRGVLIALVERLEADHYLIREGDESRFGSTLVRRAWRTFQRR